MKDLPFTFDKRHLADVYVAKRPNREGVAIRHRWTIQKHYALAYGAVLTKVGGVEKRGRAVLYYCGAKSCWSYPLRIEHLTNVAVGRRSHGVASALLHAYVVFGVPPSAWRLFPVPKHCRTPLEYIRERKILAQVLAEFRQVCFRDGKPGPLARRSSLVFPDPAELFVALDHHKAEHREIVSYLKQRRP